ncbi:MAG: TraR/DksA family transcriptional regulator [Bacteriovoracaceae bacterium]|nr:TraR/DksA family transcriptional regulator [Bacteriovoracaceae bacterium]
MSPTNYLTEDFVRNQKLKLLEAKQKIMNSFKDFKESNLSAVPESLAEEGDVAQMDLDQKILFSLKEKELRTLREIEVALQKIEEGSYGICEESGEPIEKVRLERQPWARLSLYYAELAEREKSRYLRQSF